MNIIQEIKEEMRAAYRDPSTRDLNVLALLFLILPALIGAYQLFLKGSSSGYVWMAAGLVPLPLQAYSPIVSGDLPCVVEFLRNLGIFYLPDLIDDHLFCCHYDNRIAYASF